MSDYIRLLVVGDKAVAKAAAKQRGIKVRSAVDTKFYTALYVDKEFSLQVTKWYCECPDEAPFPEGTCTFHSPMSKIVYQS